MYTKRQVLLIEAETLDGLGLVHGVVRENVTTTGIDLMSLEGGQHLALGDEVVLEITIPCDPCKLMNDIRPGLQDELKGKRGMLARTVTGGVVRIGDTARIVAPAVTAASATSTPTG